MKTQISIILFASIILMCCSEPPKKYKYVVDVKQHTHTYPVTITEHTNNTISHAAGGALLGGVIGYALGEDLLVTTATGATLGAATAPNETSTTYTTQKTDTYYTIIFSDSSQTVYTNWNTFHIGDSLQIFP